MSTTFSSTVTSLLPTTEQSPAPVLPSSKLKERLSHLYALAQRSHFVFGSPLGPFYHQGRNLHLPRFVYFGTHTHDESLRLAFLSGFDHTDLRGSFALAQLIEHLALTPDIGHGLNLSFFPLVDAAGLFQGETGRSLATENWATSSQPEIELLSRDAQTRTYHGYVRVETAQGADDITVSLRGTSAASGVELVSSADFEPLPVRWEAEPLATSNTSGPLSLADDLAFAPFELILRVPGNWPSDLYRVAVSSFLKRFVLRHREFQAISHNI